MWVELVLRVIWFSAIHKNQLGATLLKYCYLFLFYLDISSYLSTNFIVCLDVISFRAFAVVASALGIPSLLPFLKAVCRSKKSWQARHTGIKIVQQIAILMGCAILPHLRNLVEIIEHGK